MLTVGVALFATFSGFLANTFLSAKRGGTSETTPAGEVGDALEEVERLLDEQERTTATLRTRTAELESRA